MTRRHPADWMKGYQNFPGRRYHGMRGYAQSATERVNVGRIVVYPFVFQGKIKRDPSWGSEDSEYPHPEVNVRTP